MDHMPSCGTPVSLMINSLYNREGTADQKYSNQPLNNHDSITIDQWVPFILTILNDP